MILMDPLRIVEVQTEQQIETVALLAREIWMQHYLPIISPQQIDFMLRQFQSADAIRRQMCVDNYRYYLLESGGSFAGYFGIVEEKNALFLSKLYIKEKYRGKRFASKAIDLCTQLCRQQGLGFIWLTVNKQNSGSIAAYQKLGFVTTREQTADIGNGFVMDDYIMEKQVS